MTSQTIFFLAVASVLITGILSINPIAFADDEEFEEEIEIEVEIEDGIAKIEAEIGDKELEFEMDWIDEQTTIDEVVLRTGLSLDLIKASISFEFEDEEEDGESNSVEKILVKIEELFALVFELQDRYVELMQKDSELMITHDTDVSDLQFQIDSIGTGGQGTPGERGPPGVNGTNGMDGQPGISGTNGQDGSSCTIQGTIVSCTDGTNSDVQGPSGTSGSQTQEVIRFDSGQDIRVDVQETFFNYGYNPGFANNGIIPFRSSASMVGIDGSITEFRYDIGRADIDGNLITATLYKNNNSTDFTCSVTSGIAVSCVVVDSLTVTKGDLLAVADVTTASNNFNVGSRHAYVIITS